MKGVRKIAMAKSLLTSYPKTVRVGPFDYKVETVDHLKDDTGELLGQHDPHTNTIRLNGRIENEQIKAETLFHELLHAVWNIFGLSNPEEEEAAVHKMSVGVAMIFRDNPALVKYLTDVWKVWK